VHLIAPEAERYALAHTTPPAQALAQLRAETEASTPVPAMAGGVIEARFLEALVVGTGARRVLEIGTFTGYSALSMAAALPTDGKVITLERDEQVASIARRHIEASPHAAKVELVLGDALESIKALPGPFDLVFIDAWKPDYAAYYEAVLGKLADGGLIVADNMLWAGAALDPDATDADTVGIRSFADLVHADARVHNVLLTVADGLLLVWKRPPVPGTGPLSAGCARSSQR
jgi:caffeoyl-CoA O-methyltransferase